MKTFVKLALAIALVASMAVFAGCSACGSSCEVAPTCDTGCGY